MKLPEGRSTEEMDTTDKEAEELEEKATYYTDEKGLTWKRATMRNAWGYLVECDVRVCRRED